MLQPFSIVRSGKKESIGTMVQRSAKRLTAVCGLLQAQTTHKTPLDNLSAHLADPWSNNVFGIEHARLIGQ